MFQNAIELVGGYTRPFVYISRDYGETLVMPSTSTMFFVNGEGCAITTRAVADLILMSQNVNVKYNHFKAKAKALPQDATRAEQLKALEKEFGYTKGVTVNVKCFFKGCVSPIKEINCRIHAKHNLALIRFNGIENIHYKGYAVFAEDAGKLRTGKSLCRLGFPYPEEVGAIYNSLTDDIQWGDVNAIRTPQFPIDGMVTRHVVRDGKVSGIELSTPATYGHNGSPLFDSEGTVYGMQLESRRFSLGCSFDEKGIPTRKRNAADPNPAFYYLGHCLSAEVIKDFLDENKVKYYTKADNIITQHN